jgi:hypothetical protein
MPNSLEILRYNEYERLDENGSNWTFWKTRITPYLKGMKLWPYVTGTAAKPMSTKPENLEVWEQSDAQALTLILMNITPSVQAGLDCTSAKAMWDGLLSRYAQTDPIAQNLAQSRLRAKHFEEGGQETLPAHIAELQRLREACGGLGVAVSEAQFAGVIMLSMPTPSWDPVVGTLGGILDPKVIISRLNTEWSRRQGLTPTERGNAPAIKGNSLANEDPNAVVQAYRQPSIKCDNCWKSGHTKASCWTKGGGQEGQYPEWYEGKKDDVRTNNPVSKVTDTHIVWAHGVEMKAGVWYADTAATVHVCTNRNEFSSYQKYTDKHRIRTFGKGETYGIGEGSIEAEVEYQGRSTRITLTKVMHVPEGDGNILSLRILDQRGFESRVVGGKIRILKNDRILTEARLGRELYEARLKIVKPNVRVLATIERGYLRTHQLKAHHIPSTANMRPIPATIPIVAARHNAPEVVPCGTHVNKVYEAKEGVDMNNIPYSHEAQGRKRNVNDAIDTGTRSSEEEDRNLEEDTLELDKIEEEHTCIPLQDQETMHRRYHTSKSAAAIGNARESTRRAREHDLDEDTSDTSEPNKNKEKLTFKPIQDFGSEHPRDSASKGAVPSRATTGSENGHVTPRDFSNAKDLAQIEATAKYTKYARDHKSITGEWTEEIEETDTHKRTQSRTSQSL